MDAGIAGALRSARVFDLEQPRHAGMPIHPAHAPGFNYFLHRHHTPGAPEARTSASGIVVMPEHNGTHIDALSHQAEKNVLHGGIKVDPTVQTSTGFRKHGIETMGPMVGRGVLLDMAPGKRLPPDHVITRGELEQVAVSNGVEIREGDVVLVRTGYGALWDHPEEYMHAAGVSADGSRWMIELKVTAVGADNMAWDANGPPDPGLGVSLPGHLLLLVRAGIPIIENLNLEELAAKGINEFGFICLPLKMMGATGSPVRPIALV